MTHRFTSTVSQLYVNSGHCYISLKGIADPPKDGLFDLPKSHTNYNALYALALTAAVQGYQLQLRTFGEVEAVPDTEYPRVSYLVVEW